MRKRLVFIRKENGFILPSVLLLTTFVLITFSSNIFAYQHDLKMTYNLIEQMNAQTLFQMSYTTYKNEYLYHNNDKPLELTFPNGIVKVQSNQYEDSIQLSFYIETNRNASFFVTKMLKLPPNTHENQYLE